MRYMPGPGAIGRMNTAELRETFLIEDLFQPDKVVLHAVDLDRVIVGSAVPVRSTLSLGAPEAIALVRRLDLTPSTVAFDDAFKQK